VIEIDLNTSEVQKLVDGTYANYGWLLKLDTEVDDARLYASSENANADDRPKLVITYSTNTVVNPWTNQTYTYSTTNPMR